MDASVSTKSTKNSKKVGGRKIRRTRRRGPFHTILMVLAILGSILAAVFIFLWVLAVLYLEIVWKGVVRSWGVE